MSPDDTYEHSSSSAKRVTAYLPVKLDTFRDVEVNFARIDASGFNCFMPSSKPPAPTEFRYRELVTGGHRMDAA
jgi:hypothetical protein